MTTPITIEPDENNTVFRLATDFVNETSEHIFLTGKAGTGKTTFLRHIRNNTHKQTIVAAPTGVAAVNAGGVTLHSLFQLPFEPYVPGHSVAAPKKHFFRFSKQKLDMLKHLELLIIDEVSMLRADTLDSIDASLRSIRRNPEPFGGVQVLYIGDMFQLPPVAKEEEWSLLKEHYLSTFFFHAQVIQRRKPVYLELKTVYRQGDPHFVELLNRIRNNRALQADIETLNARYNPRFSPTEEEKYITLTTHNYKADQINSRKLAELGGAEQQFAGKKEGDFPDYSLPTDMDLKLKVGAQVMFLRNDTEEPRRYYNGKIASVSRIVSDQVYVKIPETGEEIAVKKETWENNRYFLDKESGEIREEQLGSFTQIPLRLAWAVTIHKSQGLTFERAILDAGSSFAAGQTYVALSRCTSLEGIVLYSKIRPGCIMTDPYAIEFSRKEEAEEELAHQLNQGKRAFWADRLLQYFEWKPMHAVLKEIDKLLQDKEGKEYQPAKQLLIDFRIKVRELERTTIRFQEQLTRIIRETSEGEELPIVRERCRKAVKYFTDELISGILIPLQSYISGFKRTAKNRTFYKNIGLIEEDLILFMEKMGKVRYNNVALAEDLELFIPRRKELFDGTK